jgi:hypothetical protein
MKMVEEHLRNVVLAHQKDWGERLSILVLAWRALTRKTTGMTPISMVFEREPHLSCNLLFGVPPSK